MVEVEVVEHIIKKKAFFIFVNLYQSNQLKIKI